MIPLEGVEETLLIPLAIKANETLRKHPRIQDRKAVSIIQNLNIDTQPYDKFMSHEGVVARTILFDKALNAFLKKAPNALCVSIGCGLDARFERVDNGKLLWYNLDFPHVIQMRNHYFPPSERVHAIAKSALDATWTEEIPKDRPTIFILEGLLMYFTEKQVKTLLELICRPFKQPVLLLELSPPFLAKMTKHHDTVKHTNATFQWGIASGKELESYVNGLKLLDEKSFNVEMKKYSIRGKVFAALPFLKNCNNRLAIYQYTS